MKKIPRHQKKSFSKPDRSDPDSVEVWKKFPSIEKEWSLYKQPKFKLGITSWHQNFKIVLIYYLSNKVVSGVNRLSSTNGWNLVKMQKYRIAPWNLENKSPKIQFSSDRLELARWAKQRGLNFEESKP